MNKVDVVRRQTQEENLRHARRYLVAITNADDREGGTRGPKSRSTVV